MGVLVKTKGARCVVVSNACQARPQPARLSKGQSHEARRRAGAHPGAVQSTPPSLLLLLLLLAVRSPCLVLGRIVRPFLCTLTQAGRRTVLLCLYLGIRLQVPRACVCVRACRTQRAGQAGSAPGLRSAACRGLQHT